MARAIQDAWCVVRRFARGFHTVPHVTSRTSKQVATSNAKQMSPNNTKSERFIVFRNIFKVSLYCA